MKQILAFNLDNKLITLFSFMGINVINVPKENQNQTLNYLINNKDKINILNTNTFSEPLIIFYEFTDQDLDNMIALLKNNGYSNLLKCVVTDTNINWPANLLYQELVKERNEFKNKH